MLKRSQGEADHSRHWYQDKYQHVLVQRNLLALISLVALAVALVAMLAMARLAPLKSVEPYLLQVDERTGITQAVKPAVAGQYVANEAVDKYFVAAYLRAREGYNPTTRIFNDNMVRLMSSRSVFSQYRNSMNPANKASIPARLGTTGQRTIDVVSTSYIVQQLPKSKDNAIPPRIMTVRFISTEDMPSAGNVSQRWIATITFAYTDLQITETERLYNPLGFQVVNYQVTKELL